jgi:hypothetical protein
MTSIRMTFLIMLALTACTRGHMVEFNRSERPAVRPEKVRIYSEPPMFCDRIGLVAASADFLFSEQKAIESAIRKMKEVAGKRGANGVVIKETAREYDDSIHLSGEAIYVTLPDTTPTPIPSE